MKKELVKQVNHYVANLGVSYIKMHNLHWNVVGLQFKSTHEYLEEVYDEYADYLDEVAELLRMEGELPLASLKDYLAVASIKELETKEVSIEDALSTLLSDMKALREEARKLREQADEEGNFSLVAMMEDHIANFNKRIWFVEVMVK